MKQKSKTRKAILNGGFTAAARPLLSLRKGKSKQKIIVIVKTAERQKLIKSREEGDGVVQNWIQVRWKNQRPTDAWHG